MCVCVCVRIPSGKWSIMCVRIPDGKDSIMCNLRATLVNGLHVHCMNFKVTLTIHHPTTTGTSFRNVNSFHLH